MEKRGKTKSTKRASKAKKGEKYTCDACGMVVTVAEEGACDPCGISCCGEEMSPVSCC